MIFLDTNAVIWLFLADAKKFGKNSKIMLQKQKEFFVSPMVALELTYLHEKNKLKVESGFVISELQEAIDVKVSDSIFSHVIVEAQKITWTRDTFDRLITAEALLHKAPLITKDKTILENYQFAVW